MSIRTKDVAFDRITFDARIMGVQACTRAMRIPVSIKVRWIAHGATYEEILEGYLDLEREGTEQAIRYAAWLRKDSEVYQGIWAEDP